MKNPTNLTASEVSHISALLAGNIVTNQDRIAKYPDSDINKWYQADIEAWTGILAKMDALDMIDFYRKNQVKEA